MRLIRSFPSSLERHVVAAMDLLPATSVAKPTGSLLSLGTIDGRRTPARVAVRGEPMEIPSRIYLDAIRPDELPVDVPSLERAIVGCLYTRHHIGYVRQRWLRQIVRVNEPWIVPFVVQLLGEYVVEIIVDIVRALPDLADPGSAQAQHYGGVLAENPQFLDLTRQRVASYWSCYYRGQYLRWSEYPGHVLLGALDSAATTALPQG